MEPKCKDCAMLQHRIRELEQEVEEQQSLINDLEDEYDEIKEELDASNGPTIGAIGQTSTEPWYTPYLNALLQGRVKNRMKGLDKL